MRYRRLGASGLEVSEISLGSWLTYGVGVERDKALACIDRAIDLGVNLFDTANVYGRGAAERLVGEALRNRPRDSFIVATKLFFPMSASDRGLSRSQVLKQIDASLQRLGMEYVDLYQCHRYDEDTPLAETMEALSDVVRQGKVRYIGFSEWPPEAIAAAFEIPNVEHFVSSQPQYSLLWREPEKGVFPLCLEKRISQIVWSPLAQGVLTGKYAPGVKPPAGSRAAHPAMGEPIQRWLRKDTLAAVEKLKSVAQEASCTLAQFALAWVLRESNVASAIVGATRPEQLAENAAASGLTIDPALFARAEAIAAGAST